MIQIYICEDQEKQLLYFKRIIEKYITNTHKDAKVVSARKNPQYTLFDVNKYGESPALLFLDIQLESGSRMIEIPIEDIVMVQAIKSTHMIDIYTTSQKIKETLKKMFEILGGDFIYVNKSCIVQNKKIREIDKKNHYALMPGGLKVEVSYREMRNLLRE